MTQSSERRSELKREYKESTPEAGVYRIFNSANGKSLVKATPNLRSIENRFAMAQAQTMPGALDLRLAKDAREHGLAAFSLEILERFDPPADMTQAKLRDELSMLEGLWREKYGPDALY